MFFKEKMLILAGMLLVITQLEATLLLGGPSVKQLKRCACILSGVARGALPVATGIIVGGLMGSESNITLCAVGGAAGAMIDYYALGGKKDPRIARKVGYIVGAGSVAAICIQSRIENISIDIKKRELTMRQKIDDSSYKILTKAF